jgi:hypothetical protein
MKLINSPFIFLQGWTKEKEKQENQLMPQEVVTALSPGRFALPNTVFLLPKSFQFSAINRLLILVPPESFSTAQLSSMISRYTLTGTSILFVSLATNPDQLFLAQHHLTLLENSARSPFFEVGSQLFTNGTWLQIVKEIFREGDLILCLQDHKYHKPFSRSVPLGEKISQEFNLPVLIQQDVEIWSQNSSERAAHGVVSLILTLVVILLFTGLQIQINQSIIGWIGWVLFWLVLIVEFVLILILNKALR